MQSDTKTLTDLMMKTEVLKEAIQSLLHEEPMILLSNINTGQIGYMYKDLFFIKKNIVEGCLYSTPDEKGKHPHIHLSLIRFCDCCGRYFGLGFETEAEFKQVLVEDVGCGLC